MTEKIYTYTYTRMNKDGTIGTYTRKVKHLLKSKTKEITEDMAKEIIYKWKLGVSKTKLRREYDLSQKQIDRLLLNVDQKPGKIKKSELDKEVINMLSSIQLGGSSETTKEFEVTDLLNKILRVIYEHVAKSMNTEANNETQSMNTEANNENEAQSINNESETLDV